MLPLFVPISRGLDVHVCVNAVQIEGIVKQLALAGDHDKITALINLLTNEFTYSPQANHRMVS